MTTNQNPRSTCSTRRPFISRSRNQAPKYPAAITGILLLLSILGATSSLQAQGTVMPTPAFTAFDNSGKVISGGKLCTYVAGTTTPATTYNDVDLAVGHANTNPVIADSAGRMTVFLSPGNAYKFVLRTAGTDTTCATGSVLWTRDNVTAVPSSSAGVDTLGTAGSTIAAGQVVYLSDGSGSLNAGQWYPASSAQTYSSITPAVGVASGAITAGTAGTIRLAGSVANLVGLTPGANYYVGATAGTLTSTAPAFARRVGTADSVSSILVSANPPTPNVDNRIADGRLTLTTATPVTTSDVTAATTLYYTPYAGNRIALYDGAAWNVRTFTELSITNAGLTASKPYDVFVYDNAGAPTLELNAWTNDTTPATAHSGATFYQDGVPIKAGTATRRYVGTVYTDAASKFNDSLTLRHVWNYYNQKRRPLQRFESTANWTYSTATIRQANNAAANQVDVVIGVAEQPVHLQLTVPVQNTTGACQVSAGIGLDSTTAFASNHLPGATYILTTNDIKQLVAVYDGVPAVGRHYLAWLEYSAAVANTVWYGTGGFVANAQSGLLGWIEG